MLAMFETTLSIMTISPSARPIRGRTVLATQIAWAAAVGCHRFKRWKAKAMQSIANPTTRTMKGPARPATPRMAPSVSATAADGATFVIEAMKSPQSATAPERRLVGPEVACPATVPSVDMCSSPTDGETLGRLAWEEVLGLGVILSSKIPRDEAFSLLAGNALVACVRRAVSRG